MTPASPLAAPEARQAASGQVAVIDIGSNSVRLVVYDGLHRAPAPVFNERVLCGLGRSLADTGNLDGDGIELAIATLRRFRIIVADLGATLIDTVATAAVRDARDGARFVARLEAELGLAVRVLDGREEARISALGVVSGRPGADGIVGDLGGGSLELVELDTGRPRRSATLPLGSLRLGSRANRKAKRAVDAALDDVDWLPDLAGRTLFAVGGSWRALARLHIAQNDHPVSIVHNYRVSGAAAEQLAALIAGMSRESLDGIAFVPRRRLESLPTTAMTLLRVLRLVRPGDVVFSAFGVREGLLFDRLSPAERGEDPLLAACQQLRRRDGRGFDDGAALWSWLRPLFADAPADRARLHRAACELRDIAWRTHPDYRAEEALTQVIRAPFVGIDHPGRVFLGLAMCARYGGETAAGASARLRHLVDERAIADAHALGTALRLASVVAADGNHLAEVGRLDASGDRLTLALSEKGRVLYNDLVARRFEALARALGKTGAVADMESRAPTSRRGRGAA